MTDDDNAAKEAGRAVMLAAAAALLGRATDLAFVAALLPSGADHDRCLAIGEGLHSLATKMQQHPDRVLAATETDTEPTEGKGMT